MTIEEMKSRKKELGYSMRELSERSGVPFGTVQKIFSGATTSPRHETVAALEKVLRRGMAGCEYRYIDSLKRENPDMLGETAAVYGQSDEKKQGEFTIEDWENLPDNVHAELINGNFYLMASPLMVHQELVSIITARLYNFISSHNGQCRVFPSPTGCRLFLDDKTMVEPDISVICSRDKITRRWMDGAPDMVVEVLSPSNRKYDLITKLALYENAGVREYWIIDPEKKRVLVYEFTDAQILHIYTFDDRVPVGIWNGKCVIDFAEISKEISYLEDDRGNY